MSGIEFNFTPVGITNISLNTVVTHGIYRDENNKHKKDYYYLSADLDSSKGKPHLHSSTTNSHYTLENLFVVGPLTHIKNENATLILSFKPTGNNSKNKHSLQYICFPLNINGNKKNENFLTGVLNSGAGNKKTVTSIDLNEILGSSDDEEEHRFSRLRPEVDMVDIDIYFYSDITEVYFDASLSEDTSYPKKLSWITPEVQEGNHRYKSEPVKLSMFVEKTDTETETFTTLWDWGGKVKEPMETIVGKHNSKLTEEDQIYIQCAPAGASEQTEMVQVSAKGGSSNETRQLNYLTVGVIVVFINIMFIGLGYKAIYNVVSMFFVQNIIENIHEKHLDKRRGSPLNMFMFWAADIFPHFTTALWGKGNERTPPEKVIRVFSYAFYLFVIIIALHALRRKNMGLFHFAMLVTILFLVDVFFFFVQISNTSPEQYQLMREDKIASL